MEAAAIPGIWHTDYVRWRGHDILTRDLTPAPARDHRGWRKLWEVSAHFANVQFFFLINAALELKHCIRLEPLYNIIL